MTMTEETTRKTRPSAVTFRLVLLIVAAAFSLPPSAYAAQPWLRLWEPGRHRDQGQVEVTGKTGKDFYRRVGHWTFWYRNGQKEKEGDYTAGVETGGWEYWYRNGVRMMKGAYDGRGQKDGPWSYQYENGTPHMEGTYRTGAQDGHWVYWYKGGMKSVKEMEGDFVNGAQSGRWVYWYEDGVKAKEGSFVDGLEDGPWTYWYPDGERKCWGNYRTGLETGEWTYRDRPGGEWDGEEGGEEIEWSYRFAEDGPSGAERDADSSGRAAVGHWIVEKELSGFENSRLLPVDRHHVFLRPDGRIVEVLRGNLRYFNYTVEDEKPENRRIEIRFGDEIGRGAVLFGLFSRDYRRLVGRYYPVDFLRGSRGRLINYFAAAYAGTETGPVPPESD